MWAAAECDVQEDLHVALHHGVVSVSWMTQYLELDDANLILGMLAPDRLSQLIQFRGLAGAPQKQMDEASPTPSSLQALSLDDKVALLSALEPSAAAAILGTPLPAACQWRCQPYASQRSMVLAVLGHRP